MQSVPLLVICIREDLWFSIVFLQRRDVLVVHLCGDFYADEAEVPALDTISGDMTFICRITPDKSILMTMSQDPLSCLCIDEVIADLRITLDVDIQCQSERVLRASRIGVLTYSLIETSSGDRVIETVGLCGPVTVSGNEVEGPDVPRGFLLLDHRYSCRSSPRTCQQFLPVQIVK